jgi:hypothetical protein
MDESVRLATRRGLHAVAERIIAGHQYRAIGTIRLSVRPNGFTSRTMPGSPGVLAVDGTDLVVDGARLPIGDRRLGDLAAAAGVECRGPEGVYELSADIGPADVVTVHPEAAAELQGAWVLGDAVLRAFGSLHAAGGAEPVLWPEHLDVAITVDEVNFGVSPGDAAIAEPYAYVGPHQLRTGAFWNAPWGAALPLAEVTAPTLRAFFEEGRSRAASDPAAH